MQDSQAQGNHSSMEISTTNEFLLKTGALILEDAKEIWEILPINGSKEILIFYDSEIKGNSMVFVNTEEMKVNRGFDLENIKNYFPMLATKRYFLLQKFQGLIVYDRKLLKIKETISPKWKNNQIFQNVMYSACEGRDLDSVAICGDYGFVGEFNMRTGKQTGVFPQMLPGFYFSSSMTKVNTKIYAINAGLTLYLIDFKAKSCILKLNNVSIINNIQPRNDLHTLPFKIYQESEKSFKLMLFQKRNDSIEEYKINSDKNWFFQDKFHQLSEELQLLLKFEENQSNFNISLYNYQTQRSIELFEQHKNSNMDSIKLIILSRDFKKKNFYTFICSNQKSKTIYKYSLCKKFVSNFK